MAEDLRDKVVMVTGSAKSIGKGIALEFAGHGCKLIIADKDESAGEATAAQIRAGGGSAQFIHMDLTSSEGIVMAIERAEADYGAIDTLVNNAAIVEPLKPFLELSVEEWDYVMRANVTGTFLLSQAAARLMVRQGNGGTILNLLAIQTESPLPGYAAYCTSKGGLEVLTRSMAVELAPYQIRVNGISLGAVYADSVRRNLPQDQYPPGQDDFEQVPPELDASSGTLVGRLGRPSDAGKLAVFLASSAASFLTGAVYKADGGRLLNRRLVT
ncbi:glucose 1-dehydrogenase/3-oxoacyl-[acyl-carrier protein] reductase/2-deoxy-D-gluconate 3-dehydrogenase [Paenibacillaceae bacterium GAS479]|nr:glucose 1-dehydrogenase/3-oxoacyl-[acyl-carrier protein] reductase/2-deoxy-D-gluconate 3-dehydrogenase [Paenibacillaceae bacterium GAS479]